MTMLTRIRAFTGLLVATVLLPLAVLAFGLWERQRGAADRVDLDVERSRLTESVQFEAQAPRDGRPDYRMTFENNGQLYGGPLALAQAREARDRVAFLAKVMAVREALPPIVVWAAGLATALSVLVLFAGFVLGWLGRTSREMLVRGFALVRHLLPAMLAAQVVLGTVAFAAAVAFEAVALARPGVGTGEIKMLVLAALAIAGSLVVAAGTLAGLRRTRTAFEPDPLIVFGRLVSADEALGLWRLVKTLSERLGALAPEAIAVGLTGGFFVSAGPKVLEPGGMPLSGRTLYLPLPYLPLLRVEEVAAIIGHELAHFAGRDTDYTLRFLPIYAGVGRSLDAVNSAGAGSGSIFGLLSPALRLGLFVMARFHNAVRHWSRAREFAADADGAGQTSREAVARALLRTGAVEPHIAAVLARAAARPNQAPPDLVAAVFDGALAHGIGEPADWLGAAQPHPTDTHPPTRQRLAKLGVSATPHLLAGAAAPPPPGALAELAVYLADPASLCRTATADFLAEVRRRDEARTAHLAATAASVGAEDHVLRENTRAGALTFVCAGIGFALAASALALLGFPGLSNDEARFVAAVALACGVLLGGFGTLWLRRGERVFLVFRPEALAVSGLDRAIAWTDIADVDVKSTNNRVTARLLLSPDSVVPRLEPGARKVKLDAGRGIVTVTAVLPRRMRPRDFADLLGRYRQAAAARRYLGGSTAAPPDTAVEAGADRDVAPQRSGPMRLAQVSRGPGQTILVVLSILMFGAMLAGAVAYTAPALVSDWQVRDSARPIAGAQVTEGRCSAQLVFEICNATLLVPTASGTVARRLTFAFTGVTVGSRGVRVLADPTRLALATTDMALERLWNRTVTLTCITLLLLALTVLPAIALARNRRRAPV